MNSPLLLLIFPAILLAYPIYAVLTNKKRNGIAFEAIVKSGFRPTDTFKMIDLTIAIDRINEKIALVDFDHLIIPRGMQNPVDRDSFSARTTEVILINEIECLKVNFQATGYIECILVFKAPNRINSSLKLEIPLRSNDEATARRLISEWPTKTAVIDSTQNSLI